MCVKRSTDANKFAARVRSSESAHYTRRDKGSFDDSTYFLTVHAVDNFRRLGKSGSEFVDQLATGVVEGMESGNLHRKGVVVK